MKFRKRSVRFLNFSGNFPNVRSTQIHHSVRHAGIRMGNAGMNLAGIDQGNLTGFHRSLVFSGSDWCAPCMKLDRFIWQSEEFKAFSNDHFILLRADFPKQKKNKLSDEQQAHNDRLAAKYNRNGYFPLVVILNKNGEIIGTTGYKNLSPAEYIKQLIALEK